MIIFLFIIYSNFYISWRFVPICYRGFLPIHVCYRTLCDIFTHIAKTYFMQILSVVLPLVSVHVVCVVLRQSRSNCPENQVLHSNDRCCQYIRCKPRKYNTLSILTTLLIDQSIDWWTDWWIDLFQITPLVELFNLSSRFPSCIITCLVDSSYFRYTCICIAILSFHRFIELIYLRPLSM